MQYGIRIVQFIVGFRAQLHVFDNVCGGIKSDAVSSVWVQANLTFVQQVIGWSGRNIKRRLYWAKIWRV